MTASRGPSTADSLQSLDDPLALLGKLHIY
jgi:hypothetical protein